jgi:hypothetical protein
MGYYKLIREPQGPSVYHPNDPCNAVRGTLYAVEHRYSGSAGEYKEYLTPIAPTLEHADYLIPALVYKVQVNLSPRFGTLMPMLLQVPGRTGIRIHGGTKPSHSRGCVLITRRREYQDFVKKLLEEQETCAPIYIEVCDYKP